MGDRLLVLVRHGQSEWNLKNLFTGWKDPDLTEQGVAEEEALAITGFQVMARPTDIAGGFSFGRRQGSLIPHMNPVSTASAGKP